MKNYISVIYCTHIYRDMHWVVNTRMGEVIINIRPQAFTESHILRESVRGTDNT